MIKKKNSNSISPFTISSFSLIRKDCNNCHLICCTYLFICTHDDSLFCIDIQSQINLFNLTFEDPIANSIAFNQLMDDCLFMLGDLIYKFEVPYNDEEEEA